MNGDDWLYQSISKFLENYQLFPARFQTGKDRDMCEGTDFWVDEDPPSKILSAADSADIASANSVAQIDASCAGFVSLAAFFQCFLRLLDTLVIAICTSCQTSVFGVGAALELCIVHGTHCTSCEAVITRFLTALFGL